MASISPDQEKCHPGVVPTEKIEKLWRNCRIGPVVKGDCERARGGGAAGGWTEKLRARVSSAISGKRRAAGENGGRGDNPRIHAAILA